MLQVALVFGIGSFDPLLELVDLVFGVEYADRNVNLFCQCAPSFVTILPLTPDRPITARSAFGLPTLRS